MIKVDYWGGVGGAGSAGAGARCGCGAGCGDQPDVVTEVTFASSPFVEGLVTVNENESCAPGSTVPEGVNAGVENCTRLQ